MRRGSRHSMPWPRTSHRINLDYEGLEDWFLVAPSPPWSGKLHCLRLGLKNHAVSAVVWKVSLCSPRSQGVIIWSRRLRFDLESRSVPRENRVGGRAASALFYNVAPILPRLRRSRELIFGCAVSALVWNIAPSPPWSGKLRCLRLGLKNHAVSALVWIIAPSPPWSGKLRCPRLGLKNHAVSAMFWKVSLVTSVARSYSMVAPPLL